MIILRRALLILACSLLVMICYPNYPESAYKIVYTWAGIAFVITLIVTVILDLLVIGRIRIVNVILDLILVVVFLHFLLNIFPQLDGQSPYEKIRKGKYPTKQDIDNGLYNLGLTQKTNTLQGIEKGIIEMSDNVNEVKSLIMKEHKD